MIGGTLKTKGRRSHRYLIFALPFFLASCGYGLKPLSSAPQYKSVAFVSLMPATLTLWHKGITVFQNHSAVVPLSWNPNRYVGHVARTILERRYKVVRLNLDRKRIMTTIARADDGVFPLETAPLVSAALKSAVKPGTADIIVVLDATSANKNGESERYPREVGLYVGTQFMIAPSEVATLATFEIFDGTTFEQIAQTFSGGEQAVKFQWYGKPYDKFSPETKRRLYVAEHRSLNRYVKMSLMKNHLS